ncbi:MAG TPA: HYR domain-containing protein, partial [Ohtaekwangia sp.]|nr:HYR domain-containing protein [Ohtaekwangia sp.]
MHLTIPICPRGVRIKREVSLALKVLLLTVFLNSSLPLFAQNCDVDFPGVVTRTFSGACGGTSTGNLELGINNNFSDGDVFIFDVPLVTITGNLHVDIEGNGKIVIPTGVTVDVKGHFDLHIKNGGCTPENPCTFTIEVNGNASFGKDFKNDAFTIVWSGTGTVSFEDKIRNSNDACMTCGPAGCPQFQADPSECRDDGDCPDSDFCDKIIACSSDVTRPIISGCPANQTVNVVAPGCNSQPISWVPPTANDNCALSSFTSSHAPGSVFPKGITTVTYTATDAAGNTATCSFDVTVVDNTAPVITGCPANITVNANASCQAVVNWTAPTFTDNCAGGTITTTKAPGSIFNQGITTVTYTATDAAGNTATCSFNVN